MDEGSRDVGTIYYMIRNRIQENEPNLFQKEVTGKIFLRFYQNELTEKGKERIIASIKK